MTEEPEAPPRRRRTRGALWLTVVLLLGGLAGAVGLSFGSQVSGRAGPGTVELAARVDRSPETELLLPPFGSISAGTHRSPVSFSVRVAQVDVAELGDVLGGSAVEERLRDSIEADLRPLARSLLLRCLAVGALAGAAVGAVVPRRRWRTVVAGTAGGFLGVGALVWIAWMGFDPAAFEEPTFRGPVREAPRLITTARSYVEDFEAVRDRIRVLSAQVRDLYAVSLTEEVASGPGRRRILHVSDLHLNPVGVEVVSELVERFDVDAILDTGDITTFGFPPEGQFGELIENLAVPYFLVPGNHDSEANREALAGYSNLTVVDGEAVTIAGVRVLGVAHPVFTADNNTPKGEVDAEVAAQAERTRRLVTRTRPDVLAVHDPAQAAGSAGRVPVVVAGHLHRRTWKEEDGTLILTVGSTGATGLGAFTVDADLAYEAQILYFDGGRLVAVDNVALRGTRGEFSLDRRLVDADR